MENEKLVKLIQNGEKEYLQPLYMQNKGLIHLIIKRCGIKKSDIEDALQDGYIGLHKAAEYYKIDNGAVFVTFAYKLIKQSIVQGEHKRKNITFPDNEYYTLYRIQAARRSFVEKNNSEPSISELSEICGLSAAKVENLLAAGQTAIYLNAPCACETTTELGDMICAYDTDIEELSEHKELTRLIKTILEMLNDNEKKVIIYRYLHGKTQKEAATLLHRTSDEVRRLEQTALRKLNHYKNRELLKSYI